VAVATLATSGSAQATSSPAAAAAAGTSAPAGAAPLKAGNYIVTMAAPPVATYGGGISGMQATRPARGARLDARSTAVQRYRSHLLGQQTSLLRATGVRPTGQYTVALNGFSAKLTAAQAAKLAGNKGVLSVTPDTRRKPDLFETPKFLGLQGRNGTWAQVGGVDKAGKGVVVGVLDTGVWPENPFFAGTPVRRTTPGGAGSTYLKDGAIHVVKKDGGEFVGTCQAGEEFYATTCNSKLVGARFYDKAFVANVPADLRSEFEFLSPRDGDGHGSHTSSTAVGNQISGMNVSGRQFGPSSGMAPTAKLATYKVCWESSDPDLSGCFTSDMLTAIDDAVSDGVDVINFSIGGSSPEGSADPVELAFLNAAAAGVFVSASAGNSGPGASTVGHNSPWLTTVAATTAHRFEGTVQLGNGTKIKGASFSSTPVPASPAILGSAAALAGADPADALLCFENTLDPAKVAGKVVVCDRGVNDRVAKSAEVKRAGGVGLVMTNPTNNSLNADDHSVPTVHVQNTYRQAIHDYVATAGATIALLVGDQTGGTPTPLPVVAGFSSRGPDLTSGGDLVKPDIAAPGVDIVAAVAPGPNHGNNFEPISGTSMSAPHIAGLAALILGKRPEWSPAAVKSAMMTTASDTRTEAGAKNTNPFDQGAGFVNPRRFLNPGLVYDSDVVDWVGYLEGTGVDTGTGVPAIDPSDVNVPSIGIGSLAGTQTVTRRVTAVKSGTYRAHVNVPGVRATVAPSVMRLRKGQTASFTVTFTRTSAALDTYATGFLTWASGGNSVRSPIAVQPVALAAPGEVHGTGASGTASYAVTAGATGAIDLSVAGLTAGDVTADTVAAGELNPVPGGDAANKVYEVKVPEGTTLARFDEVAQDAADDLDMFVFDADFNFVDQSATGSASERVDLVDPAPGTYFVLVNGFSSNDGTPIEYTLRKFLVGSGAAGNLTATPDPLPGTLGQPATVTLSWSGLDATKPYLGSVGYSGSDVWTIVSIG
jgi:subtilisin family serine protease